MTELIRLAGGAPAKINLFLEIVGRRDDGYHLLNSLFLPVSFYDALALTVSPAKGPIVHCQAIANDALCGAENLAHRAALAYLNRCEFNAEIHVELEKRIWVAAGLGGGSSDAALTLRLLNDHYGALSAGELQALALALGADVPYFLDPRAAQVSGIGEIICPVSDFPKLHLLLVNPGRPLSTAAVFRDYSTTDHPNVPRPQNLDPQRFWQDPAQWVYNDLQPVAFHMLEELSYIRDLLCSAGARATGMTGSGPTLFGVFQTAQQAMEGRRRLSRSPGLRTEVCFTL